MNEHATRRSTATIFLLALLLHAAILVAPIAPQWLQRPTPPPEPEEIMQLLPEEAFTPDFFGDAAQEDDRPAPPSQEALPAPPDVAPQVLAMDAAPPAPQAEAPAHEPEPFDPPELEVPPEPLDVTLPTLAPAQPSHTPTAQPTITPTHTPTLQPTQAPTQPPPPTRAQPQEPQPEQQPLGEPSPLPDLFDEFNRERREQQRELAMAEPSEESPPSERYQVSRDGSLTIYPGAGRRGVRAIIDFGDHPPQVRDQVLKRFDGSYWQGYRNSVEASAPNGPQVVGGVISGNQRLHAVTHGGPGYYIIIHWGDQERLGRHFEELVMQALRRDGHADESSLEQVVVGIRLRDQRYEFYVQSMRR